MVLCMTENEFTRELKVVLLIYTIQKKYMVISRFDKTNITQLSKYISI